VVDLLDSIQTLVRDAGGAGSGAHAPCFVVAADGRWLRQSYEDVYDGFEVAVAEPGRPLGYLFLDKIFQLTVDVPSIGAEQRLRYLQSLLHTRPSENALADSDAISRVDQSTTQSEILAAVGRASPADRAAAVAAAVDRLSDRRVEIATEHELEKFAVLLAPNPRSMKRFINAYSMTLSTALLEGRDIDPEALALWTLLRLRWPSLADAIRLDPEIINSLRDEQGGGAVPEDLAGLASSRAVRRVVLFGSDGLTVSAVRGMTGNELSTA
jgi:hypothetical protein